MTRVITWSLITSYYDSLPLPRSGLMRAAEPWSGHFEIQPGIWAAAHTTQFASPGWRYIDSACGYLKRYGSYVTLRSPAGDDYSIVVETMDSPYITIASVPQEVTFHLGEGFPEKAVHVWKSNAQDQFIQVDTIQPKNRTFRYTLDSEAIYTFSTTTGQRKGGTELAIPESTALALPYTDNFDTRPANSLPKHFIDQSGVFEVVDCPDRKGGCLRQVVPAKGIEWHYHANPLPYTVMGDERWRDYQVEVDALLDSPGQVAVYGRITNVSTKDEPPAGYWLSVDDQGNWRLNRQAEPLKIGRTTLAAGKWQRIGLRFAGDEITAVVNGQAIGSVRDGKYSKGLAGIGCDWHRRYFDNLSVNKT
jgi:galactosylceramidase